MDLRLPIQIDRERWMHLMGIYGDPTIELLTQMRKAERTLMSEAMPRGIYRIMPVEAVTPAGKAIKRHLENCTEVAIMSVTLGITIDNLIRTRQIKDLAEAFVLDCGASVMVEQIAGQMEELIKALQYNRGPDIHMTGRYSPGYADYPVALQSELIWLADAHRKIGVTVNQYSMITPQKSITAVMGISDQHVTGYISGCEECVIKDSCVSRKDGMSCAGLKE